MSDKTLTTVSGKQFNLRPVSDTLVTKAVLAVKSEFRARGEPIDPPTYTTSIGEIMPHDETSIIGDEQAEQAWKQHITALEQLQTAQEERKLKALMQGVIFEIADDGWQLRHQLLGVTIPSDPAELWWHYLTTEVLETPEDLFEAVQSITLLSYRGAVDEEALKAAMASFRDHLQQSSIRALTPPAVTLEAQSEIDRSADRERVEPATLNLSQPAGK